MNNELYHFGVKGMKWGHRKAYSSGSSNSRSNRTNSTKTNSNRENQKNKKSSTAKKVAIGAATVAGLTAATYGSYKVSKYLKSKAGKRSYELGKKYAEEHFFSKADIAKPNEYHRLMQVGSETLGNTDRRTRKVSNSTIEAIKYLRHPERERYIVDDDLLKWRQ